MSLLVSFFHIGLLFYLFQGIWKNEKTSLRIFFWPALVLKLTAGICLGLLYKYYYTIGDTFTYFEDGIKLSQLARTDILQYIQFLWSGDISFLGGVELQYQQPRALFFSKITSVFCLITVNNYWIIALYFSAIAFVSVWSLTKKIASLSSSAENAAVIGFLFFPSVVFWSSGLIKESLAMACLFFLSFIFLKVWMREKIDVGMWVLVIFSIWILWNLKYYYLAVFMPVVLTAVVVKFIVSYLKVESMFLKIILWCAVFFFPVCLMSILHPNFYPNVLMEVIVSNYNIFQSISAPEDLIHYGALEPTPISLLKNAPLALFSGFFRPFITEVHNPLQVFSALENLILLFFLGSAILGVKKIITTRYRMLLFSIVAYSMVLCIFLALSTPNFGTLSRYRVGFLPFLVFLLTIENPLVVKLMRSKVGRYLVR
jgi:hypothetical protein